MNNADLIAVVLRDDGCHAMGAHVLRLDNDRTELLGAIKFLLHADPADKPMAELAAKIAIERAERE